MSASIPSSWTTARLREPSTSGFIFLGAASAPWHVPPALPRRGRRRLIETLRSAAERLRADPKVIQANVFRGFLKPPGGSAGITGQAAPPAHFDAVLIIETDSSESADRVARRHGLDALASHMPSGTLIVARNARRIADVDHSRQGVFLINYFSADDVETNLDAWQYTAGWFQDETKLDNSTVLVPLGTAPYTLLNHCRWDHVRSILPSLLFKRSFRQFVLKTFDQHRVAPRPILYRLAN